MFLFVFHRFSGFHAIFHANHFLLQCKKDCGKAGDGTTKGTCTGDTEKCHADGTCSVCAAIGTFPHSGCSEPNPLCSGGSCKCTSAVTCDSGTASVCDGVSLADDGLCKCGSTGKMCSGTHPKCSGSGTSATCHVGS